MQIELFRGNYGTVDSTNYEECRTVDWKVNTQHTHSEENVF